MERSKRAEPPRGSVEQLVVRSSRVWTSRGLQEGSILINRGKIRRIARRISCSSAEEIDGKGLIALPGLIDAHVHLRDLKLAYKEDFNTGTSAAAAGGFTSVLDMPNTKPATDSPERLKEKMKEASEKIRVNVGFHVAAVPESRAIAEMTKMGAFSLKLYLPKPISPLQVEKDQTLLDLMIVASSQKIPISVHAEDASLLSEATPGRVKNYTDLARARPPEAEVEAVNRIIRLQKLAKCSVHFAHITLPTSLRRIHDTASTNVSSEVTPHHMVLSTEILPKLGWKAWMIPPLRTRRIANALLREVGMGRATIVGSDHAPHDLREKSGPVADCPPGIPGLETTLPVLLTLVSKGRISLSRVVSLLSVNPSRVFGIVSKGRLQEGADADVTLVDLKAKSKIRPENFLSKAKYSPFDGFETRGQVRTTIVGGRVVYDGEEIVAPSGTGEVLRRGS